MNENSCLTYCEIDLKAVEHNLNEIVKLSSRNKFYLPTRPKKNKRGRNLKDVETVMPIVKANAYGHGVGKIAPILNKKGVGFFGVSDISEGIALREFGIKKPVLLFESTLSLHAKKIIDYQLMPTVCTLQMARALNRYAQRHNRMIDIHIKVDTGMGRLGIWHEEAFDFIKKVSRLPCLRIMGIFTHFPAADTDRLFTKKQIQHLYDLVTRLDRTGIIIPYIHAANSMGLAGYQTHVLNLSRPGLMLYGLYPHPALKKKIRLKPVMSVRSCVIFLKEIKKGRSISYGRTFFTKKDMLVATVPIGYNDGYFRAFSNRASVLIDGIRCPVLGRVTMDQIMVDVSKVNQVKLGSPVTILGNQGTKTISADELAEHAGTINYEIVCSFGGRLPKVYVRRK